MEIDQVAWEPDKEDIFKRWICDQREPTISHPPDFSAQRVELSKLDVFRKILSEGNDVMGLAINGYIRELMLWRLFPFHALPDDIILRIFHQGVFCSADNPDAATMPMIYASICKRWRYLALGASWLWSFLRFQDVAPYPLTKLFLERSMSAPLIIEIDLSDRRFDWEDDTYWPTTNNMINRLSLLLPHIHRWKSFSCCTDNWAPIQAALTILQDLAAPILKRIEFRKIFDMLPAESRGLGPIKLLGGGAPALKELVLHTVSIDWHNVTFSNLSELELQRLPPGALPTLRDFWTMLNGSPNLRKLVLIEAGPERNDEMAPQLPRIELPRLEELEFQGTGQRPYSLEYALFVLSMFGTAPTCLRTLDIGGFAPEDNLSEALPWLNTVSCVEHLSLSDIHFTTASATAWLRGFPKVRRLTFRGSQTQRAVMQALAAPSREWDSLCPSLATLGLWEVNFEAIHAVIQNRLALGLPIKKLLFNINLKEETIALNPLRSVVEFEFDGDLWDEWTGPDPSEWPMED